MSTSVGYFVCMGLHDLLSQFVDNRRRLHLRKRQVWFLPPRWFEPREDVLVIEIVGSKWKTTVAYLLSCNLSMSKRVGMFTSPHLVRVNERIQVWEKGRAREISDQDLERHLKRISRRAKREKIALSYFEALFLAAMSYFDEIGVKAIVMEAGLGGRLDATNSVRNDIVLLTRQELEHTNVLGRDLESIVKEKLGVVKESTKKVFVKQDLPVDVYFKVVPRDKLVLLRVDDPQELAKRVLAYLRGSLQFREVEVPGRLEKHSLPWGEVILDVAHTPLSVDWVLRQISGRGWTLVIALARDKDVDGIRWILNVHREKILRFVLVDLEEGRFFSSMDLFEWFGGVVEQVYLCQLTEYYHFWNRFEKQLVIGSHRLVGEVKRWLSC